MDIQELVRMIVRNEIEYIERDVEKLDQKLRALAKSIGKTIPWEPSFVVTDAETPKDE